MRSLRARGFNEGETSASSPAGGEGLAFAFGWEMGYELRAECYLVSWEFFLRLCGSDFSDVW